MVFVSPRARGTLPLCEAPFSHEGEALGEVCQVHVGKRSMSSGNFLSWTDPQQTMKGLKIHLTNSTQDD